MIDANGYRPNVGIIIANHHGKVFLGKRLRQDAWQFPQGGVDGDEDVEEALFRELWEEVGLTADQVKILGQTRNWLRYKIPKRLVRDTQPLCIGQKQKWFLLRLEEADKVIQLDASSKPEFDDWAWVSYWYPLRQVISFKREVYRRALRELAPILFETSLRGGRAKPLNYILDG